MGDMILHCSRIKPDNFFLTGFGIQMPSNSEFQFPFHFGTIFGNGKLGEFCPLVLI